MIHARYIEEAVAWRRHLHANPELGFAEVETADFIGRHLESFGVTVHRGLGGTGIVGTLSHGSSRRSLAIRADIDALPIHEETGAAYASRHAGRMHACGHDGHTAMLLLAARLCAEERNFDGTIRFIFQPAEENEGGGRRMVEEGLFRAFPADEVYALHNWPALSVGTCVARDDAMMAAFGTFEIAVEGRGAHGAMPHEGNDPVVAACQIVGSLQTIASRNVSPLRSAVVSVTQVHSGDAWNVIPERAVIRGTTRWFDPETGDVLERRVGEVAAKVADAMNCRAELTYERRYPATVNDPRCAAFAREVAGSVEGISVVESDPSMAAEDFAFMLQACPGAYLWLGSRKEGENPGLHSARFDFNDAVMGSGARLWTALIEARLAAA